MLFRSSEANMLRIALLMVLVISGPRDARSQVTAGNLVIIMQFYDIELIQSFTRIVVYSLAHWHH